MIKYKICFKCCRWHPQGFGGGRAGWRSQRHSVWWLWLHRCFGKTSVNILFSWARHGKVHLPLVLYSGWCINICKCIWQKAVWNIFKNVVTMLSSLGYKLWLWKLYFQTWNISQLVSILEHINMQHRPQYTTTGDGRKLWGFPTIFYLSPASAEIQKVQATWPHKTCGPSAEDHVMTMTFLLVLNL